MQPIAAFSRLADAKCVVILVAVASAFMHLTVYMGCDDEKPTQVVGDPDTTAPAAVTDLRVLGVTDSSVTLTWTSTGDDGMEGSAYLYDHRLHTTRITEANWREAWRYDGCTHVDGTGPSLPGLADTLRRTCLTPSTVYFFGLKVRDEAWPERNWSELSNVVAARTLDSPATGSLIVVEADGSGDYPTLGEAVVAAAQGDTLELGDGLYMCDGTEYPLSNVVIRSRSNDPTTCMLDNPRFRWGGSTSRFEGMTFSHCSQYAAIEGAGGILYLDNCVFSDNERRAVYCRDGSRLSVTDCRFSGNAQAIQLYNFEGFVLLASCLFEENTVYEPYQAVAFDSNSNSTDGTLTISIQDCRFHGNQLPEGEAVISIRGNTRATVTCELSNCVLDANGGVPALIHASRASVTLVSSTVHGNRLAHGGAVFDCRGGSSLRLQKTIVAFNEGRVMQLTPDCLALLSCSDLHGNSGGDWVGRIANSRHISGNLSADPLFCDPENGDFHLQPESPCSPDSSECGLIGAVGVGCE